MVFTRITVRVIAGLVVASPPPPEEWRWSWGVQAWTALTRELNITDSTHNVFNHQHQNHNWTAHVCKQHVCASGNFFKFTSSLFKLSNGSMHRGETWYACVLHQYITTTCFHDNHILFEQRQIVFFFKITSLPFKLSKLGTHVYYIVSMTTSKTTK